MSILNNIWLKRAVALIEYLYAAMLLWLGIKSFFFDTSVGNSVKFWLLYVGFSLLTLLLVFFTRKTVLTSILAMLMMFLMVPVLFFNIGSWWVVVPPMVVALISFFACGAREGIKTVFGTIFLLGYIIGTLLFFVVTNLFIPKTVDKIVEEGVSASGAYRYSIIDTQNQSKGSVSVYVEPNTMDFERFGIMFKPTGYAQRKYFEQKNHDIPTVEFKDLDGDGIEEEIYINGKRCDIKDFEWTLDPKAILL